jgi:hypothetical protein
MKTLAVFLALVMTWAAALPGNAQQPHWLVGTWEGEVRGLPNNPTGTRRNIIVKNVAPDGANAQATWNTESTSGPITILINGETIAFKAGSGGNDYKLVRNGNVLEGSWISNAGRSGGITLTRK